MFDEISFYPKKNQKTETLSFFEQFNMQQLQNDIDDENYLEQKLTLQNSNKTVLKTKFRSIYNIIQSNTNL